MKEIYLTLLGSTRHAPGWNRVRVFATGEGLPAEGREFTLQQPARYSINEHREAARETVSMILDAETLG